MIRFVADRTIYEEIILSRIPGTQKFLWLATANIKDLYTEKNQKMVPFLEILSDLIDCQVNIRLLHASDPGSAFQTDFDRYPNLIDGLERLNCRRIHFKSVIIDGEFAYLGSANITGAGMGAKSVGKRNFENGIITDDLNIIDPLIEQFDAIWRGERCEICKSKKECADYLDLFQQ